MPSSVLSLLQLKGDCRPTGDGEQVDVTGSWYKDVFILLLPLQQLLCALPLNYNPVVHDDVYFKLCVTLDAVC